MYYKECGSKDGQLVVFIHGGFTTHESFMKQYDLLPDKKMIFVDLPGCGNHNQDALNGFSFENAAFEVIKLIEELSPDRKVIMITHSYGGLVVKEILLRIPHRIDKMVVGSTNIQKDAWHKFDISGLKGNHQMACLLLYAEHDIKEIQDSMKLWKEKFPNSKLCEISKSGHNYFFDMPEIVNPIISDFCQ